MLFNSYEFLFIFLPVAFIGYFLIALRSRVGAAGWLALASLCFYGWWSVKALPLLIISIGVNYWLGIQLSKPEKKLKNKLFLYGAISANLTLLGYFKYAGFFISSLNMALPKMGVGVLDVPSIVLPIGISFYTFTQIAFLVDCWQGKVQERRFIHYALFVSYFPHLIAGPVLHHSQMMPQFAKPATYRLNFDKIAVGIIIFVIGLSKKIMIADPLSVFADSVFNGAAGGVVPSLFTAWFGVLSYAFQIYFDFSGYSDMAIGLSLLFGINLPLNFNSPYRSTNIIDFWRRWHISLSTFLRDYLYIPLGGSKNGIFRRYTNLLLTMLLGGLWHGASWNFMLWGGLHGLYLVINHGWRKAFPASGSWGWPYKIFAWAITFVSVCFAWVVFRAADLSSAIKIYSAMVGLTEHDKTSFLAALSSLFQVSYVAQVIELNTTLWEMIALLFAWGYSLLPTLIALNPLDGLQLLVVAFALMLSPYNTNRIAASLDVEKITVEKTYLLLWMTAAFYLFIKCIWMLNKHHVFIYFQF